LCEVVEGFSPYSDLISPSNDEINEYLKQHDHQVQLLSIIEECYSEALTQAFGKQVDFKVDIPQDLFREEELRTLFAFREKLYTDLANQTAEASLATMPEQGWAWIYAERVSAFLEVNWLKVIELYQRRCGNAPESLHWNSHSQFVKQHSQENFILSVNEAINVALLSHGRGASSIDLKELLQTLGLLNDSQRQPVQTVELISALNDYRRIALFLHYENKPTPTAAILLQQYGKPSLKKLKEYYNRLHGASSRRGAQGKELVPMIEAIESVIPVLSEKARQLANEDLSELTRKR
jgi:hypothetical protein